MKFIFTLGFEKLSTTRLLFLPFIGYAEWKTTGTQKSFCLSFRTFLNGAICCLEDGIWKLATGAGTGGGVEVLHIDDTTILRDRQERPCIYFDTINCLALIIVALLLPLTLLRKPSIATMWKRSEYRY